MKAHPNYHVAVNLGVMLFIIGGAIWCIWSWLAFGSTVKIIVSVFAALIIVYTGHRFVPRYTNSFVEMLFGDKDSR